MSRKSVMTLSDWYDKGFLTVKELFALLQAEWVKEHWL